MHQYRAVLVRLRQGDSNREIARPRLMGRTKVARSRALAAQQGWLAAEASLPEDPAIAAVLGKAKRARSTISTVELYREIVERWSAQKVSGVRSTRRCAASTVIRGAALRCTACWIASPASAPHPRDGVPRFHRLPGLRGGIEAQHPDEFVSLIWFARGRLPSFRVSGNSPCYQ